MKRVLVAGAGALGTLFAARLSGCAAAVTLLARGQRRRQLMAEGVRFEQGGVVATMPVPVAERCDALPQQDIVILAMKTGDLADVLDLIAPVVGERTVLLTLQNGVDAPDLVAARFAAATVAAARVHGFFELRNGLVHHAGVEPSVLFGLAKSKNEGAEVELATLLTAAGIANQRSDDILRDLWEKFLLASAIGAVGTALVLPAGRIASSAEGRQMLKGVMAEIACIAARKGIGLPPDCVAQTMAFVASFPPEVTSSLQRDLEDRRPSEYASLTGAAIRMAGETGCAVPVLARCEALIRARGLL